MSLFAVRDGKLKYINNKNCPNIIVMADLASKANYNNSLFTIYHTLQFAKHNGIYWGVGVGGINLPITTVTPGQCATSPQCENTFGMLLVHHWAELAFLRCSVTPCHIVKFCLHVLSHRHVLSPREKTYRKIHSVHGLSLFYSNIVIHLSSSLDVCIGVRECARALCCVVFYYPRFR